MKFITTKQASELLGYTHAYVRRLVSHKKIYGFKIGHDTLIDMKDINKFILKKNKRIRGS